ncbi:TPA: CPBP family intramembrane metalloprotease [Bacillus thuringiensis]|uniref:CPBP family intramembrane glutamic endopeptidase n=1 Tax=Bacillus TaxID=1386 RepID=UPI00027BFEA7|nr:MULTISPECIES: type II CAAX endopeptidase family protein [Bacillus]EJV75142.1 hypothetical protein IGE_05365 [Bacillus cereus HuB1-1]KAA6468958.1 CPBP family intramembrane metalloprotease [Bacillus cereus]KAB2364472.1 CPBP family intramembrane metalloprotease [Bacillus thuringiensis]KAB2418626.1 CPBP family intramembrane metalloprotease [Bacillus cereus]KAB2437544.1 CPBP family intramembrane metalloprotease [Bacillus cereus]
METKLGVKSENKISDIKPITLYLFVFYLAWTFKELWLAKYIHLFGDTTAAFLTALIKISIWIVPTWLYIKYYLKTNPIGYLKININVKKGLFFGVVLSLLLGLYFAFETYMLNNQTFDFTLSFNNYLNAILLVGITEEIVFRGLILQEISKRLPFWNANLITAFLFLAIHYPIWIYNGDFLNLWSQIYVFLLGLIFGFVFKKTGSLWSVVILHSFHNFFVSIT